MLELKKSFVKKLNLLKKSKFLPRSVRHFFISDVWSYTVGSCCNSDLYQSLGRLHCRAARLIFDLPKDMASAEVLHPAQWPNLRIINLIFLFVFTKLSTIGYLSH